MSMQINGRLETCRPTQRAPGKWDSARFTSLFLASGFYYSQAESRPAHLRVLLQSAPLRSANASR
jgi:hypothetical protein